VLIFAHESQRHRRCIRSEEAALKRVGVKSLALVGFDCARHTSEASDVDVLIDVANEATFR